MDREELVEVALRATTNDATSDLTVAALRSLFDSAISTVEPLIRADELKRWGIEWASAAEGVA